MQFPNAYFVGCSVNNVQFDIISQMVNLSGLFRVSYDLTISEYIALTL